MHPSRPNTALVRPISRVRTSIGVLDLSPISSTSTRTSTPWSLSSQVSCISLRPRVPLRSAPAPFYHARPRQARTGSRHQVNVLATSPIATGLHEHTGNSGTAPAPALTSDAPSHPCPRPCPSSRGDLCMLGTAPVPAPSVRAPPPPAPPAPPSLSHLLLLLVLTEPQPLDGRLDEGGVGGAAAAVRQRLLVRLLGGLQGYGGMIRRNTRR